MKVILIRKGCSRTLAFNGWAKVLISLCMLGLPVTAGALLGIQLGGGKIDLFLEESVDNLEAELEAERRALAETEARAQRRVEALSLKLAQMQARLVRLDALGERLTTMADLDKGEFDFSSAPPLGGPESLDGEAVLDSDLKALFAEMDAKLEDRQQQLGLLAAMLADRKISRASTLAGRPITQGWMSSVFGYRTDPFNGRRSWHSGVDFAGKKGSDVVAVASGVVTWSGEYRGYGNMVEVDHGEGFVTRYAHNQENRVDVGDLVQRGQQIALMGSSGRSTGPHVHFEVYKNGRPVDPSSYIHRTLR